MCLLQEEEKGIAKRDVKDESADNKQFLVRMLAAYLDLGATLTMEGSDLDVKADMKGLRLETLIELEKASGASSSDARTGGHKCL